MQNWETRVLDAAVVERAFHLAQELARFEAETGLKIFDFDVARRKVELGTTSTNKRWYVVPPMTCPVCEGHGVIKVEYAGEPNIDDCPHCDGTGEVL